MKHVAYTTEPERIFIGDVAPARRAKAVRSCASASGKFAWLRMDVCATQKDGPSKTEKIATSVDVVAVCREFAAQYMNLQEFFGVLCLDSQNQPVGFAVIAVGSMAAAPVDLRLVFKPVLLAPAAAMIVTHNHPSGDPSPSAEDFELTKRLSAAAKILGVRLLDHVIVADQKTFSFLDNGVMPR